ncbi:Segregation and condensation protein B [Caenispirillum salinarum AK4]|uniref:Segregation and condensation protein B n=1 Tax=Caenispirillum salinarum AK4 TaxID=1238182 RepID=K9HM29_9PROT|nr:SMC-Scp complex subunit ScpB [Caenispirillum salinarum]EKV31408.1 Segregation and condensation protein B [Caenispirillum salinarum AK4]
MDDATDMPHAEAAVEAVAAETDEAPPRDPEAQGTLDLDFDHACRIAEAVLFASAEPVSIEALKEKMPQRTDARKVLKTLMDHYKGRGVQLTRAGDHYAFRTAPDLAERLGEETVATRRLSRAAIETLAIIAYHQPVTRAEIEEVRGVALSKGTLDTLLEAGWIRPRGRRPTPGRPLTWGTTDRFLDHFGLESLKDLPGVEELKAAGLLDARPAITAYGARAHDSGELVDTDETEDDGGQYGLLDDEDGE